MCRQETRCHLSVNEPLHAQVSPPYHSNLKAESCEQDACRPWDQAQATTRAGTCQAEAVSW